MATPPPFVGRHEELAALVSALDEHMAVVIQGAVGSGKSRLALQVGARAEASGTWQTAYVRCLPGDREVAVRARAERVMDLVPGTLARALAQEPWLLILDDVHHLSEEEAARVLACLLTSHALRGRLVVVARDLVPLRRDVCRTELVLEGLDQAAARDLWAHLEETYGPTRQGACDAALTRTRGMPLALRREYARAASGDSAWDLDALEDSARRALEAIAVLRVPVGPAGIAAMRIGGELEPALMALVSLQLIDPLDHGRFAIHDVVREQVLGAVAPARRCELEQAAAELIAAVGRGMPGARRLAWQAGDDGALGYLDPVDRLREAVLHHLAAGQVERAVARVLASGEPDMCRGAGGEIVALIDILRPLAGPERRGELDALHATIAARHGHVAEALELRLRAGAALDPVETAELGYRAGDVASARRQLEALCAGDDVSERCRAAAVLAEIEVACGHAGEAEALVTTALQRDRARMDDEARARLHLALALTYEHTGRAGAARAALLRAAGRIAPALAVRVEARRGACLAQEGRLSEAETALAEAERVAREIDAAAVVEEVRRVRCLVALRRGDARSARAGLCEIVSARRLRGDDIGALAGEIDLAHALVLCGELPRAAELVSVCIASAARRRLDAWLARAHLAGAAIDMAELRPASAQVELDRVLASVAASADVLAQARILAHVARAWRGEAAPLCDLGDVFATAPELCDDIALGRARALAALACDDAPAAFAAARDTAIRAERAGRVADLVTALALSARLFFARGEQEAAAAAAARALREARMYGLASACAHALLVLAAHAREHGDLTGALAYAREALDMATAAGLPLERLIAAEAGEAIAGADAASAGDVRSAVAATMSPAALGAAARFLADLGLISVRPYRVVSAGGAESQVADASPERLHMTQRSLAIDAVREVILRDGATIADVRRRSLLKHLLFLFAGAPGQIFSKEDIVERVWQVEYHPLRHDAALFTNIMRIRRMLGVDGADLLRVCEDGYRFVPPMDYLYVGPVGA